MIGRLKDRLSTLRLGDPLDKTPASERHSREQLDRTARCQGRRGGGRGALECGLRHPRERLRVRSTIFTNVQASHRIAREGSSVLCCRCSRSALPRRRSRRPTTRRTDCRPGSGPTRGRASSPLPTACAPASSGRHLQPVRPRVALRRLQGVGLRPGRRTPRTGCLPCTVVVHRAQPPGRDHRSRDRATGGGSCANGPRREEGGDAMTRLAVPKTYKLYIGGKFRAASSGRTYEIDDARGEFAANVAKASRRTPAMRSSPRAAPPRGGLERPLTTADRSCTASPSSSKAGGPSSSTRSSRLEGADRARRHPTRSTRRSTAGSGSAGWTDKHAQVAGNANAVAGRTPDDLGSRTDRRGGRHRAAGLVAARLRLGGRAAARGRQHGRRGGQRALPLSAVSLAEVLATSDVPGGVVNGADGVSCRDRAVARIARRCECARSGGRVGALRLDRPAGHRRDDTLSGCSLRKRVRMPPRPAWSGSAPSTRRRRSGTPRACSERRIRPRRVR